MPSPNPSASIHLFDLMETASGLLPGSGVLGERADGTPFVLNVMGGQASHMLISGDSGSGKTALLRAFAASLALSSRQAEVQIVLIDTDLAGGNDGRGTLLAVSYLPHNLAGMIVSVEDALAALNFLLEEIEYRAEQGINRPHIVVFIDHLLPLLVEGGVFVEEALQCLVRQGATAGIHLIVATRRSDMELLQPLLREAWPVRIIGLPAERSENGDGTGAGEFRAHVGETETIFNGTYVEDDDLERCLENLRRYRAPSLIARPLPY